VVHVLLTFVYFLLAALDISFPPSNYLFGVMSFLTFILLIALEHIQLRNYKIVALRERLSVLSDHYKTFGGSAPSSQQIQQLAAMWNPLTQQMYLNDVI